VQRSRRTASGVMPPSSSLTCAGGWGGAGGRGLGRRLWVSCAGCSAPLEAHACCCQG
jgi:hypothetical protein